MPLPFTWNPITGQYRNDRTGRFVPLADVREGIDRYLDSTTQNVADALFESLRSGRINVRELQLAGERQIAIAHGAAAATELGGRANMTFSDWGRVGRQVRDELGYWRDLMQELADGRPLDGRVKQSLRNYLRAAAVSAQKAKFANGAKYGFDQILNVLNDGARHCESKGARPSCPAVTDHGPYPANAFPLRGSRACYWNCRCSEVLVNSETGEKRS
jgi:hypothetical protein